MIVPGCPTQLGARIVDDGVNFAVYSGAADTVELCLFDADDTERRLALPANDSGVWHGFVPECGVGQRYGFRVHGTFDPNRGLRANPAKLLMDPYARALDGAFRWAPAVFDHRVAEGEVIPDTTDSAVFVPKSVVTGSVAGTPTKRAATPWKDTVLYEANVRGYTMRFPDLPEQDRGRFAGLTNAKVLEYLRSLGITSIELMPVFEFIDEQFLAERELRNFWGYNTIAFFTPAARYATSNARDEFVSMVNAIHDAGLEVILDVVYNHTGESGSDGPTLSLRGLDNLNYYRTDPGDPGLYVNDTGTGNTLNIDSAPAQRLVLDSLRYWFNDMGVDGFRFDLAPVLGRTAAGFDADHPFLRQLAEDHSLKGCKLIAEPWDPGPGGYQLGQFPGTWSEWNDRYRDSARRFWRGDLDEAAEFAMRLHGSADLFENTGRGPRATINFVTAHDGFTLADLVSYRERHNEANGEDNLDGHAHNFSDNYGVEGPTEDDAINALRRQQRLNFLGTLLLSQGTPMLLAGDEIGNSQAGNNNGYAQDNEIGWIDWQGLDDDPEFLSAVRSLIRLRSEIPQLRQPSFLHERLQWLNASGSAMSDDGWHSLEAFCLIMRGATGDDEFDWPSTVLMFNRGAEAVRFTLPEPEQGQWAIRFVSAAREFRPLAGGRFDVAAHSMACMTVDRRQTPREWLAPGA